jgi:hypothetical protein
MDGNKKVVQRDAKAKVHFTESWINFLKHNEIEQDTWQTKGGGGLNIHFFPIFLCVQEEYVM